MERTPREVEIYTDGYCQGNPGRGGYGAVLLYGAHIKELCGGFRLTTNNRMEKMAVIVALSALKKRCSVTVFSDSRHVVDGIAKGWAGRWRKKGWMRTKKEMAVNSDLWARLLDLCERHEVKMVWVKGHSGINWNERADELSMTGAMMDDLPVDEVYEIPEARPV